MLTDVAVTCPSRHCQPVNCEAFFAQGLLPEVLPLVVSGRFCYPLIQTNLNEVSEGGTSGRTLLLSGIHPQGI